MTDKKLFPPHGCQWAENNENQDDFLPDWCAYFPTLREQLKARAKDQAEIERLRVLLSQATNDIEDWGAYATEYFQNKHDLEGNVARYRAALSLKDHDGQD